MTRFEKFFNNPFVYNAIQFLLAWAGGKTIFKKIEECVDAKPGDSILDVGCGTGKYTQLFKNANYTGVDLNDSYLNYARKKYPFGKFINMDATKLAFPDKSFHFIFSVSTFHHLSDDQIERAVAEMKRVCRDQGSIYIIDNVFPRRINFLGHLLFKLDRGSYQRNFEAMRQLLSNRGFAVLDSELRGSFPYRYIVFKYTKKP